MSFSPSDSKIFGPLFSDSETAIVFSDERYVEHMLAVEAALARVLGEKGVIPPEAGDAIAGAAGDLVVDFDSLRRSTEAVGFPIIELVRQIREHVGEEASDYVHWGATTQDILDTARVLQIREALLSMETDLQALIRSLAGLADKHRHQLMPGRTHSQQALPITFGYKAAAWLAPLIRHRRRLADLRPRVLVIQFGGAVGTLAPYGERASEVYRGLALELDLGPPTMPWHTQRDSLGELASWLSLLSGTLAKMAQDVILLTQTELGELSETADPLKGGSSTLPQKRNPVSSELILAAARANASLLASVHLSMVQEHERATSGWQLEWLSLPQMFALTGSALRKAVSFSDGLVVDGERMQRNLDASQGLILAEAIQFGLAKTMKRERASALVKEACQIAVAEGKSLIEVVKAQTDADLDWESLANPQEYLGATQWFIDRVLEEAGHYAEGQGS